MSNALNIELEGKYVVVDGKIYKDKLNIFLVEGGFGTSPDTRGTAVFGKWLSDGANDRINGHHIKRLAKPEEVEQKKRVDIK